MSTFITILGILKYIGLLGLPVLFSNDVIWKYFALFWLFGVLEILLTIPVFIQALHQIFSMPYVYLKYKFKLPNVDNYTTQVHYSLPFDGKWTVINGSVDKSASHSWNIYSQRYAYDFVQLDKEGNSSSGNTKKLENYHCYGNDVLAPADGVVVAVKTNHRNSKIYKFGRVDHVITDIRGNYIIMKHAEKEYSCLAHLLPLSINVRSGQAVKQGEIIAKCGNSGNSTEPHLHFQIQDSKSFFYSMGLPIKFFNINSEKTECYSKFDKRSIPDTIHESKEFIHRGLTVNNI
jgi:hypothetical protein